jgi:hypothetical protein
MYERVNPKYVEELRKDASVGTPLFDQALSRKAPPETVKPSETRRESHQKVEGSVMQSETRERVLNCIKRFGPISSRMISVKTGLPREQVTARISELADWLKSGSGEIFESDKIFDTVTNRKVTSYKAKQTGSETA